MQRDNKYGDKQQNHLQKINADGEYSQKNRQEGANSTKGKDNRITLFIVIAVCAVALALVVVISGNGTNGLIDANADFGNSESTPLLLEAKSPVEFPEEPITVEGLYDSTDSFNTYSFSGSFQYKVNSVEIVDNLYEYGLKPSDLDPSTNWEAGMYYTHIYMFNGKKSISLAGPFYLNTETGQFLDDIYLMIFEIEIYNIDASWHSSDMAFDYADTDIFRAEQFFCLKNYNENFDDGYCEFPFAYLKENNSGIDVLGTFKAERGKTTTLHVGFLASDNLENGYSNMELTCADNSASARCCFNMSKMVEDFKANGGNKNE